MMGNYMKKVMLINAVHAEQKRMAIVEDGKLVEFNIQMAAREPLTGNIYKGIVLKVERGLQAAFVNFGGKRDGFLPLRDVRQNLEADQETGRDAGAAKATLKPGQAVLVQVVREVSERKGALLTMYLSLPGRYLVLMPYKQNSGVSRKIEDEADRKRLRELIAQIKVEEDFGLIVRTAGFSRTKQELSRDYQHLYRLWKEIQKRAQSVAAPALIYQESDFGVRSLRDYFTSDIEEILVDDLETFRKVRAYCKAVSPRNVKVIKQYKEKMPLFDLYNLEDQIRIIYQERVDLKSGGYLIINPTEAMITIDVNSGRGSNKRSVEETAYKTNIEAAEEIARQLRLRDLGGLIVIDFIDMRDRKHNAEVEKTFKKALSLDRARIQLSRISRFGILELSRQKKQSTIQEISYSPCPYCRGRGVRPSLEYVALSMYRRIESQVVKGTTGAFKASLPYEIADYLLNQKRHEIVKLESLYGTSIHIYGSPTMDWDDFKIELFPREAGGESDTEIAVPPDAEVSALLAAANGEPSWDELDGQPEEQAAAELGKKKPRRRSRHRRRKGGERTAELDAGEHSGAAVAAPVAPDVTAPATTTPPSFPPVLPPASCTEAAAPAETAPAWPPDTLD